MENTSLSQILDKAENLQTNASPSKNLSQILDEAEGKQMPSIAGDPWTSFDQQARQIAKQRDFPVNVLEGQAAVESGRGTSPMARQKNNYFGYMAYDSNPDAARSYQNPSASINDYISLIENDPRYAGAYQRYLQDRNPQELIQGIWQSGYATDKNYVGKVMGTPEFQGGNN